MKNLCALMLALASLLPAGETETRLKEIASIEGVRDNQLIGYGLVVGLNRTGDKQQTVFSFQALTNMLRRMGIVVDATTIQVRNMAAVMVTATLPPFAQPGTHIDVTVAAVGDATSLQGGLLLLTPLKAANGETYAVAQGSLLIGGYATAGRGGTSQTVNHPTAGRVPSGAIVEKAAPSIEPTTRFNLQLRVADFTTAARVAEVLNKHFAPVDAGKGDVSKEDPAKGDEGSGDSAKADAPKEAAPVAHAESSAVVAVSIPAAYASRTVEFVAELENLTVEAGRPEKIVINERTGTIVLGKEVRISPVAILHGTLTVEVRTTLEVSQPLPSSQGQTVVVPQTKVDTKEEKAKNVILEKGATVEQLVRALQTIGSTPRDIIAILENMRSAGALDAEIEVL
jgi:flagellar P-ring protein precursor FlgI